jgi:hypothetical protein
MFYKAMQDAQVFATANACKMQSSNARKMQALIFLETEEILFKFYVFYCSLIIYLLFIDMNIKNFKK